jgi:cytochrome c
LLLAGATVLAQERPGAGDPGRGQTLYAARCSGCHSVDEDRVGPHHRGVLGRKAGGVPGFEYSDALAASKLVWSRATLAAWLTEPDKLIPGQKMGYRLDEARDRADVVAYLASLK